MADVKNDGFGRRLRSAARWWADRRDVKISAIALADAFEESGGRKITRQTMARWLQGYEPRSFRDVEILAALLGQSAGWLSYGEGQPRLQPSEPIETTGTTADDARPLEVPPPAPRRRNRA